MRRNELFWIAKGYKEEKKIRLDDGKWRSKNDFAAWKDKCGHMS